jgi:ATP-binding cassette subfamily B protein
MLALILITTGLNLLPPLIFRDMIDHTLPDKNINRLVMLAAFLLLIPAIGGGINVFQRRLNASIGEGVIFDLRVALYARLQRMSMRFFTNTKVGELMSRLNNDVIGAQNAISNTIVSIITNLIQAIGIASFMLALEWRLTLASIIILPLFFLAARRMGAQLRVITRQQMEANAELNAMMNETLNIGGTLLVKLFGRATLEVDRFQDRAAHVRDLGVQRAVYSSIFFVIIGLVSAIGSALIYGMGGFLVIRGTFTVGTIVAFGSYLGSLYSALSGLTNAPVEFASSIVSFERVFEVIDLPEEIQERPNAIVLDEVRGELSFESVSFNYSINSSLLLSDVYRPGSMMNVTATLSGKKPNEKTTLPLVVSEEEDVPEEGARQSQARDSALEDITFSAQPGQLIALVGPSGAGKTTLTYLVPRLYDPTSGVIRIDGIDLHDVTLASLSEQIGMVTQETHLFHDTISMNLRYARLNATLAELENACKAANIHDFISDLPDRYETIVGERGYRLSGGEKQRIALARVILKNPRILVLDEATSSLDSESESLIQQALKRVMAGRTSLVIAHRLSTILAADLILVIDRGQIVERGTHGELLKLEGLYSHLYQTQFQKQD